jgi:hypothetical protein
MSGTGTVTVIRPRWWANAFLLVAILFYLALGAAMGLAGLDLLARPGGWWKGPVLLIGAIGWVIGAVLLGNFLFTYRVEVDRCGLRIIGNLWRHDLTWQEITRIRKRHNFRGIGYHVHITVDGSRSPHRHWSGLWLQGYRIATLMDKGPTELTAYLERKRRESLKRQQEEAGTTPGP